MRYFYISSNSFEEAGYDIGHHYKCQIKKAFEIDTCFIEIKEWCETTDDGKRTLSEMAKLNQSHYPQIYEHLVALARGCDQSLSDILIVNLLPELEPIKNLRSSMTAGPTTPADCDDSDGGVLAGSDVRGCTDIHTSGAWGHSEDGGNTTGNLNTTTTNLKYRYYSLVVAANQ
jgi:hypothetical protein